MQHPAIDPRSRPEVSRRWVSAVAVAVVAISATLAAPALAQSSVWPTDKWSVMEQPGDSFINQARGLFGKKGSSGVLGEEALPLTPRGERADIASAHRKTLEEASRWYRQLGFAAPYQVTEDQDLDVSPGEAYLGFLRPDPTESGSSHNAEGLMMLTSNPGYLSAVSPLWELMRASAVHEIYHGLQSAESPSLRARTTNHRPMLPDCRSSVDDGLKETDLSWFVEGSAAMVQVRWLEREKGAKWGHPFKGSHRAGWVRHFDQPLHKGSLPPEQRNPPALSDSQLESARTTSWWCSYGSWYFWYAAGDMIGRNGAEKVAYTKYLLNADKPWDDGGIANVDAGLKAAAEAYNAIGPYRGGLYHLYPQFVAQYLTDDRFYGQLEQVDIGIPGLYETTSSLSGGPLQPIASRAWRVRIRLPRNASAIPHTVRITLDAPEGTDRDDLHLIVDDALIGRPSGPTVPYAEVQQIDTTTPTVDSVVEYLVRVANVAEDATETDNAEFSLRVEVEGYYGEKLADGPSVDLISGALPPGFDMRGPGPWSCSGKADSRSIFDLITPDERGRDLDRIFPEGSRELDNMLDAAAVMIQQMQQQGQSAGISQEQLQAMRQQAQAELAAGRAQTGDIGARADKARAERNSELAATFVGSRDGQMCQVTLSATLAGRQGGAQMVPMAVDEDLHPEGDEPSFDVEVYPSAQLLAMQSLLTPHTDPHRGWEICAMTDKKRRGVEKGAAYNGCPPVTCTAGKLTLEQAEQGRIAGTMQFDVVRWPEKSGSGCRIPAERGKVVAHFNVSSTDDGNDDNSLGGVAGLKSGMFIQPGAPILNLLPAQSD